MTIWVRGAREHNLQAIDVDIPRNKLVVVTGVSGSGKSSLVFDTVFAACQREYLDSLNSYARRSLPRIPAPDVDSIEGISPCIIIDQQPLGRNPRSTVGTVTEAYTFLRLLFSRLGQPILDAADFSFNRPTGACATCTGLGTELVSEPDRLIDWNQSLAEGAIRHRTWKVGSRYWNIIRATGYFDMNKPLGEFTPEELERLLYSKPERQENREPGYVQSFSFEGIVGRLLKRLRDARGQEGASYDSQFVTRALCSACDGSRLNERAREVRIGDLSIVDLVTREVAELVEILEGLKGPVADAITKPALKVLRHMVEAGIGYLTLSRSVADLSNGESQRVRLARQMGSSLTEIIYALDEPTVGLHPQDVDRLIELLLGLRDKPNTLLVVEHDRQVIQRADYVIDLGPGAGENGGQLLAAGSVEEVAQQDSATGHYLTGDIGLTVKRSRRLWTSKISVRGACLHNLADLDVDIPCNVLVCLTGVSGSGKSSFLSVLAELRPSMVVVDQGPIGASSRSNPVTYTRAFGPIRKLFARETGQSVSLFTFNGQGACPSCKGLGQIALDMHFLGDIATTCEECRGERYRPAVLQHRVRGLSIADILRMTVSEAVPFFEEESIRKPLQLLLEVGLGYLRLGQPLNTLSGGERQRIKLASRLGKRGKIYALDEPTLGLHLADVQRLLTIFDRLVDGGNTVIVVEHNLDVVKNADWIIDLGPGGGRFGGRVVAQGTPEEVANAPGSKTGHYLAAELNASGAKPPIQETP